jgi:hypothetical protein
MSQVTFAISLARNPALTDNRTMTRLRSGVTGGCGVGEEDFELFAR